MDNNTNSLANDVKTHIDREVKTSPSFLGKRAQLLNREKNMSNSQVQKRRKKNLKASLAQVESFFTLTQSIDDYEKKSTNSFLCAVDVQDDERYVAGLEADDLSNQSRLQWRQNRENLQHLLSIKFIPSQTELERFYTLLPADQTWDELILESAEFLHFAPFPQALLNQMMGKRAAAAVVEYDLEFDTTLGGFIVPEEEEDTEEEEQVEGQARTMLTPEMAQTSLVD
jgi:hypothetical protein